MTTPTPAARIDRLARERGAAGPGPSPDAPGGVLVGIDGSPASLTALRWADWYATATGRPLHVVHAWPRDRGVDLPLATVPSSPDDLEIAVEGALRELVARTLPPGRPAPTCRALRGDVGSALAREATVAGADLVVVGRRGTGRAREVLLGSTSRALTACPVHPVAILPEGHRAPPPGSWATVVGVDGSDGSARAVRWAAAEAARGDGEVVAVHAFTPPGADLRADEVASLAAEGHRRLDEEWCAPLRSAGVRHRAVVERGDPRAQLPVVADEVDAAFVVLGARGLGPITQRLLGSVTHDLVRHASRPVVVIPSPRDRPGWVDSGLPARIDGGQSDDPGSTR